MIVYAFLALVPDSARFAQFLLRELAWKSHEPSRAENQTSQASSSWIRAELSSDSSLVNTPSKETVMKPAIFEPGVQTFKMQLHP